MPAIHTEDLGEIDSENSIAGVIEQMKTMSADDLQDGVHRRFEYRLCGECQRVYLANPLGKPSDGSREKINMAENRPVDGHLDLLTPLLPSTRERADLLDQTGDWPSDDLNALAAAGVLKWSVPRDLGGNGLSPLELYLGYERIASASLAVALVLSQRDSAVGLIEGAVPVVSKVEPPAELPAKLLRRLAGNELFVTIGIAQLTTSRQGGPPALSATPVDNGYRVDGSIPWSTGAAKAEYVVAGAVLPDQRQILFLLPTKLPGVEVEPPLPLVSLRASWTGQVHCLNARIENEWILNGPAEKVLGDRKRSLPLGQAFLATGLCRGGLELIAGHRSPTAESARDRLELQLFELRREMLQLSQPGSEREAAAAAPVLRGQCVDLALRIAHTAVALYKGTALLAGHPAQRLAREAPFLLVWSCPSPVIDCTVDILAEDRRDPIR